MKPLYIFDLDGTLALIEHRRHFVERPSLRCVSCGGKNPGCVDCADLDAGFQPDWRAFFAACVDDVPSFPVVETLKLLFRAGAEVWIWSGRSDEVRTETEDWLLRYIKFPAVVASLKMRRAGDHQSDVQLKSSWLKQLSVMDYARLQAVFDDRSSVVNMWRAAGVRCFQVADGDF